jgi:type II secretory ATPase GspE/PulE/Tfp pilus assembly ATPase PilB-like protein
MNQQNEPVHFEEVSGFDTLSSEKATAQLIELAVRLPASDLFIVANETNTTIAARHIGMIKQLGTCSSETGRRLISHFKAFAAMDVVQNRRPQDGRSVFSITNGGRIDLRINTIPTLYGEDMTVRLLRRGMERLELPAVGLHRKDLNDLYNLLSKPSGLLLVTGPTGSGKTTTLYGCLQHLNNGQRKINTIEDPIEYALDGVRQTQVNPRIDLDFPELLRSVLRQAPDVIMIGEVRDPTTADTAVLAANSGHLVLATLHAPVAAAAVDSILAYNVQPHFLSTCLLGIISQRLVRTLCPHCKKTFDLSGAPRTFEDVNKWLEPGEGDAIYSAPGCALCYREGYVDRTGVFEVLRVSSEIRRFILERRSAREIHLKAIEEGMLDLRRSALLKVAKGVTSTEEVVRMISTEHLVPD